MAQKKKVSVSSEASKSAVVAPNVTSARVKPAAAKKAAVNGASTAKVSVSAGKSAAKSKTTRDIPCNKKHLSRQRRRVRLRSRRLLRRALVKQARPLRRRPVRLLKQLHRRNPRLPRPRSSWRLDAPLLRRLARQRPLNARSRQLPLRHLQRRSARRRRYRLQRL